MLHLLRDGAQGAQLGIHDHVGLFVHGFALGEQFAGFGNNPHPVLDRGIACDVCNLTIVVAARAKMA